MTHHEVQQMEARDASRQISMLTNEWRDLSEDMMTNVTTAFTKRTPVYYGYMVVPEAVSDDKVVRILTYDVQADNYYEKLMMKYSLDFAWYDVSGRYVMFWAELEANVEAAIAEVKRAL